MSRLEKLIKKVFGHQHISFKEAEKILSDLGYEQKITGSHHVFRKTGHKHITLKLRPQLLPYQIIDIQEALINHGYNEEI